MSEPDVNFQLGQLGVNWDRVQKMKSDLRSRVALTHGMGATAKGDIISDNAKPTGKRLCCTCGTDGFDSKYWIEDIPQVHVDWEMTEEEWGELRSVLWHSEGPYAKALREAGKLGEYAPPRPFRLGGGGSAIGGVSTGGNGKPTGAIGGGGGGSTGAPWARWRPDAAHAVQKLVGSAEDTWRCQCGKVYVAEVDFAICPNDPELKKRNPSP